MQLKHISIRITGKVQGVFFRASTRDKAEQLGIHGFVQNDPDGSVYIEAEGDEDTLRQFEEWCRRGPTRASVTAFEVIPGELSWFEGFEMRR